MLHINICHEFPKSCVKNIDVYFRYNKEKEWFNNENVKRIIKNIDKSDLQLGTELIISPVYGGIPPEYLSGGCKAVILLEVVDDINIYGTRCGDNCASEILEIAKNKDIYMTLHHCMIFPDIDFEIHLVEPDIIVHNRKEFINEYYKYRNSV